MPIDKTSKIPGREIAAGGETELDLSALIEIDIDEEPVYLQSRFGANGHPSAEGATRIAGDAIDLLDATGGPGWLRPPVPEKILRRAIFRYRWLERELAETDCVERLYSESKTLMKSADEKKRFEGYLKYIEATMAPYRIARLSSEAARLELALAAGRPVPGGRLDLQLGDDRKAFVIFDRHGNVEGTRTLWETPLADGRSMRQKAEDGHLVIELGDATHPASAPFNHMDSSEETLLDVFERTVEFAHRYWYTPGNHDSYYGHEEEKIIKGDQEMSYYQGLFFRNQLLRNVGIAYARSAQLFVEKSPFIVRLMDGEDVVAILGHSGIVFGGMTPEEAIAIPYDLDLRRQMTWNRTVRTDPDSDERIIEARDVAAMREKMGSPYTIFVRGHDDLKKASLLHARSLPGVLTGQSSAPYNGRLATLEIGARSIRPIYFYGGASHETDDISDKLFRAIDAGRGMPRISAPSEEGAVKTDPFKKPGGGGPFKYKQDPEDVGQLPLERETVDLTSHVEEREEAMTPMGFWLGTVKETPIVARGDGDTFEIIMKPIGGDAAEMLGATDEVIAERRPAGGGDPIRMFLHEGYNFMGPLGIFKAGRGLSIEISAKRSSAIATQASLFLTRTEEGGARLTVHDPARFDMRPTEIPRPTLVSTTSALPPPAPKGSAGDFACAMRAEPEYEEAEVYEEAAIYEIQEYPVEVSVLAAGGAIGDVDLGMSAANLSSMLAIPHFVL